MSITVTTPIVVGVAVVHHRTWVARVAVASEMTVLMDRHRAELTPRPTLSPVVEDRAGVDCLTKGTTLKGSETLMH